MNNNQNNTSNTLNALDCSSRQAAIDALIEWYGCEPNDIEAFEKIIEALPSAQPEPHEIGYSECANSTLKMWIDNVLTDGEYSHIMDKLNAYWAERREE